MECLNAMTLNNFPQNMANIAKFVQSEDFKKLNNAVWKIF
jgi:hypothetical protein